MEFPYTGFSKVSPIRGKSEKYLEEAAYFFGRTLLGGTGVYFCESTKVIVNGKQCLCAINGIFKIEKSNEIGVLKSFGNKISSKSLGIFDDNEPFTLCGEVGTYWKSSWNRRGEKFIQAKEVKKNFRNQERGTRTLISQNHLFIMVNKFLEI